MSSFSLRIASHPVGSFQEFSESLLDVPSMTFVPPIQDAEDALPVTEKSLPGSSPLFPDTSTPAPITDTSVSVIQKRRGLLAGLLVAAKKIPPSSCETPQLTSSSSSDMIVDTKAKSILASPRSGTQAISSSTPSRPIPTTLKKQPVTMPKYGSPRWKQRVIKLSDSVDEKKTEALKDQSPALHTKPRDPSELLPFSFDE